MSHYQIIPKKEQGELLIIYVNPEAGETCIFGRDIYLSVLYIFWLYTYMLEEQVPEERDLDLNEEEYIQTENSKEEHWMYVDEYGYYKNKISP